VRGLSWSGWVCVGATMSVIGLLGLFKLLDLPEFLSAVRGWTAVPPWLRAPAVVLVPTLEIALAGMWLTSRRQALAERLALVLLLMFTGIYFVQWSYSEAPSCGCFGILARHYRQVETAKMVVAKNSVMILVLSAAVLARLVRAHRRKG
jgi:hypothetical protein